MSLLDPVTKIVKDKLKERDELNQIKHDAYKEAYREAVKDVAKDKAHEDAVANKYSVREKLKQAILNKVTEKKKSKKSALYNDDSDDNVLSPAFRKAFE